MTATRPTAEPAARPAAYCSPRGRTPAPWEPAVSTIKTAPDGVISRWGRQTQIVHRAAPAPRSAATESPRLVRLATTAIPIPVDHAMPRAALPGREPARTGPAATRTGSARATSVSVTSAYLDCARRSPLRLEAAADSALSPGHIEPPGLSVPRSQLPTREVVADGILLIFSGCACGAARLLRKSHLAATALHSR